MVLLEFGINLCEVLYEGHDANERLKVIFCIVESFLVSKKITCWFSIRR